MTEHEPGVRPNDSYVRDGDAARKATDRTAQGGGKVRAARNVGRTTQSRDESMRERFALAAAAFVVGGVVGWLYEVGIGVLERGFFDWEHGGLGIPFLQIYGIGSALVMLLLGRADSPVRAHPPLCFAAICLLTATLEYASGAAMLYGLGVQTWDYRVPGWDFMCTPDGLLSLRGILSFGVLGIILVYPIKSLARKLRARTPRAFDTTVWSLTAFIMAVAVVTYAVSGTGALK